MKFATVQWHAIPSIAQSPNPNTRQERPHDTQLLLSLSRSRIRSRGRASSRTREVIIEVIEGVVMTDMSVAMALVLSSVVDASNWREGNGTLHWAT
jgi:hypothetical protein